VAAVEDTGTPDSADGGDFPVTADRFDNISTAELHKLELETQREHKALVKACEARVLAECQVKVGKTYTVTAGKYASRTVYVDALTAYVDNLWRHVGRDEPIRAYAVIFAKRPKKANIGRFGGLYAYKADHIRADRLDLASEGDPPA
jgi:hypothetical protein